MENSHLWRPSTVQSKREPWIMAKDWALLLTACLSYSTSSWIRVLFSVWPGRWLCLSEYCYVVVLKGTSHLPYIGMSIKKREKKLKKKITVCWPSKLPYCFNCLRWKGWVSHASVNLSGFFFLSIFKLFYCCSMSVVCIFSPPQPNPLPSPASTLPLDFVHVSFIVVPETLLPTISSPLPSGYC